MSQSLRRELNRLLDRWQDTYQEDAARLRFYQRELANTRQLAARPHASIKLLLRQCSAVRKMQQHAANVLATCKHNIRKTSGTTTR
ncbi:MULTISPECIES: hypothetical protein [Aeromonas]|uniref:hypothetical protein n=1 Tax=Aeromonas TaxID=642 RepID=UPI000F97399E|nr:hypothetical protein [Aeromonas aquatica]